MGILLAFQQDFHTALYMSESHVTNLCGPAFLATHQGSLAPSSELYYPGE